MATRIATALSGTCLEIPAAARSHYHLAATMAAGGVVTLLAGATDLARKAGLDERVVAGYLELARGALDSAARSSRVADAITGPIARGDIRGMLEQIEEARTLDPELADFLEVLARRTHFYCKSARNEPQLPRS
jgi:predicted short-subunit dehydrogenase-like oxidoreductase (DUF2520 family)